MARSNPGISTDSTAASNRDASSAFVGAHRTRAGSALAYALLACALSAVASAQSSTAPTPAAGPSSAILRVCADPNNMPQSDKNGAGYENKLAEALAKDLGKQKVEYTY